MDNLILNHVYLSIHIWYLFLCLFSMHHRTATLLVAWRIITPSTTCREFFAVQEAPKWTTSLRIPPPQTRVLLGHLPTPLSLGKKVDIFHLKVDIFHLKVDIFHLKVDIFHLKVDIFHLKVDIFHLKVDILHLKVHIFHLNTSQFQTGTFWPGFFAIPKKVTDVVNWYIGCSPKFMKQKGMVYLWKHIFNVKWTSYCWWRKSWTSW